MPSPDHPIHAYAEAFKWDVGYSSHHDVVNSRQTQRGSHYFQAGAGSERGDRVTVRSDESIDAAASELLKKLRES